MHQVQRILLKRLKDNNGLRYADLTKNYDFEDNIVFHIHQLLENKYISKNDKLYHITLAGIKQVTKFDLLTLEDKGLKTFFFGFFCKHNSEILIKKHHSGEIQFFNLPSGKPFFGEDISVALIRTFAEQTGIELNPSQFTYRTLHLKTIKTSRGEVLFDDAFAIYEVVLSQSDKDKMILINELVWKPISEVSSLPNKWNEIDLCVNSTELEPYYVYDVTSDYILRNDL